MRITKGGPLNRVVEEKIAFWALHNCLSIIARSLKTIILNSLMVSKN